MLTTKKIYINLINKEKNNRNNYFIILFYYNFSFNTNQFKQNFSSFFSLLKYIFFLSI